MTEIQLLRRLHELAALYRDRVGGFRAALGPIMAHYDRKRLPCPSLVLACYRAASIIEVRTLLEDARIARGERLLSRRSS